MLAQLSSGPVGASGVGGCTWAAGRHRAGGRQVLGRRLSITPGPTALLLTADVCLPEERGAAVSTRSEAGGGCRGGCCHGRRRSRRRSSSSSSSSSRRRWMRQRRCRQMQLSVKQAGDQPERCAHPATASIHRWPQPACRPHTVARLSNTHRPPSRSIVRLALSSSRRGALHVVRISLFTTASATAVHELQRCRAASGQLRPPDQLQRPHRTSDGRAEEQRRLDRPHRPATAPPCRSHGTT